MEGEKGCDQSSGTTRRLEIRVLCRKEHCTYQATFLGVEWWYPLEHDKIMFKVRQHNNEHEV